MAKRHVVKIVADLGTTVVTGSPWRASARKHLVGLLPSAGEGIVSGMLAGKTKVEISDVAEVISPLGAKWTAPEDAFVRAQVAARVRAFVDHVRTLDVSAERRREWVENFVNRMRHEGWDKMLPNVHSRKDLKRYLAAESRKYQRAEKVLQQAQLDKDNPNYQEIRRRLLDELLDKNLEAVTAEALREQIARIKSQVERGIEPEPKDPEPKAIITCAKYEGRAPFDVRLIGSASKGKNLGYVWSIGGVGTKTGAVVEHQYFKPDKYPILLTVSDKHDRTSTASATITVLTGWPIQLTVEGIKCVPLGAQQGQRLRVAVAVKVSGLTRYVTVPVGIRIDAFGRKIRGEMGDLGEGLHAEGFNLTIPEDAKDGPHEITVTASTSLPDEELYQHDRNSLSDSRSITFYIRDPFEGVWKGTGVVKTTWPKPRTTGPIEVTFIVRRTGPTTLEFEHPKTPYVLETNLSGNVARGKVRREFVSQDHTFTFDGETLTGDATQTGYSRAPGGGKKVSNKATIHYELKRVWTPGEPNKPD